MKTNIINGSLTVGEKLMDIHKNKEESCLYPVLRSLFSTMGYRDVEVTHGNNEYGRDLIFRDDKDPLNPEIWYAVVVKNKNAEQNHFVSGGEIIQQIDMCLEVPYTLHNGKSLLVQRVIVVVNGSITENAKNIIAKTITNNPKYSNVTIWNYSKLGEYIEKYIKEQFLTGETGNREEYELSLYRQNMIAKLSNLDRAKDLFSGYSIGEINDIFVNVRTAQRKYEKEKNRYSDTRTKYTKSEEIDDSLSILASGKNTIIRGIPTSGKTILLKRTGLNALEKNNNIGVFWFQFRDINHDTFDLRQEIRTQYSKLTEGAELKISKFSKYVLLFDAIEEIQTDEMRRTIMNLLKLQAKDMPAQILITGRELDIFEDQEIFGDFEKYDLLPFDIGQSLQLVKKIIPNDDAKSNRFIAALRRQSLSNNMTRTPMALTLMAILYKDDGIDLKELPANITELYSKFSDYYLDKWDAAKGMSSQYKYEQVRILMGFIARMMQSQYRTDISEKELTDFLMDLSKTHSFEELKNLDAYLEYLKRRNTLFSYNSHSKQFSFNGISFQEYFASIYYDDSKEKELLDHAYSDWWTNVIVFYNGKNPQRTVFIEKLLNNNQILDSSRVLYNHMHLVSNCMQAAHSVPNDFAQKGIYNLIDTFDMFYRKTLEATRNGESIAYNWTTIDMILQFRKLFMDLFASKHIKSENIKVVASDIFNNHLDKYTDVTLYCLGYLMMYRDNDTMWLEIIALEKNMNPRWQRIVFKDIQMRHLEKSVPAKKWQRIKRKQLSNKDYIDKQFRENALLHLDDGTTLKEV